MLQKLKSKVSSMAAPALIIGAATCWAVSGGSFSTPAHGQTSGSPTKTDDTPNIIRCQISNQDCYQEFSNGILTNNVRGKLGYSF